MFLGVPGFIDSLALWVNDANQPEDGHNYHAMETPSTGASTPVWM